MIKRTLMFLSIYIFLLQKSYCQPTPFKILICRQSITGDLVAGTISVNEEVIGSTYENLNLKVPVGNFSGNLRYWSGHNFVGGAFGTIGKTGDFLVEVGVPGRPDILLHGGNKPGQSLGCILLGGVAKTNGIPYLDDNSALRLLRIRFYGVEVPTSTPDKAISIEIRDDIKSLIGNWKGTCNTTTFHTTLQAAAAFSSLTSGTITIFTGFHNGTVVYQVNSICIMSDGTVNAKTSEGFALSGKISGDGKSLTVDITVMHGEHNRFSLARS